MLSPNPFQVPLCQADQSGILLALSLPLQFTAVEGEYEACLSNDRRVDQDAKHVMLDVSRLGTEGTLSAERGWAHVFYDNGTYKFALGLHWAASSV